MPRSFRKNEGSLRSLLTEQEKPTGRYLLESHRTAGLLDLFTCRSTHLGRIDREVLGEFPATEDLDSIECPTDQPCRPERCFVDRGAGLEILEVSQIDDR